MKTVDKSYQYNYLSSDHTDLKEVKEEVFYKDKNGNLYSQFYIGQLIPEDIFNEVFGKIETEDKPKVEKQEAEEVVAPKEIVEDETEEIEDETKAPKKRHKSIIKK